MVKIVITDDLAILHVDRLVAWAEANGLDPDSIPVPSSVLILDGQRMTVERFVRDDAGAHVRDEDGSNVLRELVTVDIVQPFPADLIDEDEEPETLGVSIDGLRSAMV